MGIAVVMRGKAFQFSRLAWAAAFCLAWSGCTPDSSPEDAVEPDAPAAVKRHRIKTVGAKESQKLKSTAPQPNGLSRQPTNAGRKEPDRAKTENDVIDAAAKIVAAIDAGDETSVQKSWESLSGMSGRAILDALTGLVQHGNADERKNAIYALAVAASHGDFMSADVPSGDEGRLQIEQRRHDIVSAMSEGLGDEEDSVRNAAYAAMQSLDDQSMAELGQQLMGGDDSALKIRLLADKSGSSTEADISLSIMALADHEPAVREKAAENLKALSGKNFTSQQEANQWLNEEYMRDGHSPKIE